jgi:sugar O-acyltransferase (sialic acid O-acetyltransferase NeuD family)
MPRLIAIGAGGHAKTVISTALAAGFDVVCVFDDNPQRWGDRILGVLVDGPVLKAREFEHTPAVIAIGDGAVRRRIADLLPRKWSCVVHPFSYVDPSAVLGEGTVVAAGAVVQPAAVVGKHCVVNTSTSIDHDCRLGDFVTTGPGVHLAGGVTIGDQVLLGVGSCVKPGCRIGQGAILGAGAVAVNDVPGHVVAYGVPARVQGVRCETLPEPAFS